LRDWRRLVVLFACPRDKDAQGDTIRLNAIVLRIRSKKILWKERLQQIKTSVIITSTLVRALSGGEKNSRHQRGIGRIISANLQ